MPSVENQLCKPSMSGYSLSQRHLWPYSDESIFPIARRGDRFLAAIDQPTVEALRAVFLQDRLSRPLTQEGEHRGGLWDRSGAQWLVFDVDRTRQAARQRALPCTSDLPVAQPRFDQVCAPGYLGRKR